MRKLRSYEVWFTGIADCEPFYYCIVATNKRLARKKAMKRFRQDWPVQIISDIVETHI